MDFLGCEAGPFRATAGLGCGFLQFSEIKHCGPEKYHGYEASRLS